MKKIYWRPARASKTVLLLVLIVAVAGIAAVERFRIRTRQPYYNDKVAAARLAQKAFQVVKAERIRRGIAIDPAIDPAMSGLIGLPISSVTSHSGVLEAKQTSINPNWAGVIVHMLKKAKVSRGQRVAVGFSGSFPALNIAVLAAVTQLGVKPVIISSTSGSQFGANLPNFLWLDMEAVLEAQRIFHFTSTAASLGGVQDSGMGMTAQGKQILEVAAKRGGRQFIQPKALVESINSRMAIYEENSGGEDYAAYVNVGGGSASVGTSLGKKLFRPGLNRTTPRSIGSLDGVMSRFSRAGIPVIHMTNIERQAAYHGLQLRPVRLPPVGQGRIYYREEYNNWLAGGVLAIIMFCLFAFVRTDLGSRLLQIDRSAKGGSSRPQKMV